MNNKSLEELIDLAYTTRWAVDSRWNDPSQQEFASESITRMIEILTGSPSIPIEESKESKPPAKTPVSTVKLGKANPTEGFQPPKWLVTGNNFPIVGRRFSPSEFLAYLASSDLKNMEWKPTGVTMHHTAYPYLSMRPNGFEEQHMLNLRDYYRLPGKNKSAWKSGPHIFTDDKGIWVHTPLTKRGVHATSFNRDRFGIEMLGDFSYVDDPNTGRGKKSVDHGKFAAAAIMFVLGVSSGRLNFHRHDHQTSKDCPGKKIDFGTFEADVISIYNELKGGGK